MAEDLKFRISADVADLERGLDKAEKGFEDLTKESDKTADSMESVEKASKKSSVSFQKVAIGAAAAIAAFKGATAALAEFERSAGIINRFEGDISEASKRVNGLATDIELMAAQQAIANRGVKLGTKDFANFAVAVQEYAAATGKDAVQVQEQFAEAIGTGSAEALQKFGINLKGVTDKSEAQRIAIAQLEQKYGDAESSADTLAGQMGTLGNRLTNVAQEMFGALGAAIDATKGIDELGASVNKTAEFWENFTKRAREGVGAIVGTFNGLVEKTAQWAFAMGEFGDVIKAAITLDFDSLAKEVKDFEKANKVFADFGSITKRAVNGVNAAAKGAGKFAKTMETEFEPAVKKGKKGAKGLADAVKEVDDAFKGLIDTLSTLDTSGFIGDIDEAFDATRIALAREELEAFTASMRELGSSAPGDIFGDGASMQVESVYSLSEAWDEFLTKKSAIESFGEATTGAFSVMESSISSSINAAVQGQMAISEAFEMMAINLVASIGEFLVNEGVKNILQGTGIVISSFGTDPRGAGLIGLGAAEVAAGIGMGAAAASAQAPPSGGGGGAAAEAPEPAGGGGGQTEQPASTIVIQYNAPIPREQVGRTTNDTLRAASRRGIAGKGSV